MYFQQEINFAPDEVLVYLRKSRSDDPLLTVEEVLTKHEKMLDEWCEKYLGGTVPEKNKFREVVSGETIDNRPEVQTVLRLIESPKYKAVLVVEVQRLSRGDLEDAGRIIKLFRYTNTFCITPPKTYDLRNEYDRDAFERELKRGNEFLEYTKKIMLRGRLASVREGNFIGSIAPYGYEKTVLTDGKRKCPTLKIKEDEAEVVRMIFDMYVNKDMGRSSICNYLDNMGIKPPKGEYWSPPALKDMLENVHYIGKVKWNWRKTVTIVEDGELYHTRPKSKVDEYLVFDGKHPRIVSDELFFAARAKQGRNHRAKAKTKIRNPLSGLVFCQCGRAMSLRKYMKDGAERSPARLLCDNQAKCKTSSCYYEEMIDLVCEVLQNCIDDFEVRIKNDDKDSRALHNNLIRQLKKKEAELNKKEISQWEKYSEEGMPKEIFDKLNEKVLREKAEVQQALCKAENTLPDPVDYEEKLCRFRDALEVLKDPDATAAQKNKLLKRCIERIDYTREKGNRWHSTPIEIDVKLKV